MFPCRRDKLQGQEIPLAPRRSNLQTNAWESGEENEGGLRLSRRNIEPNDFVEGTVDTAKIRTACRKVRVPRTVRIVPKSNSNTLELESAGRSEEKYLTGGQRGLGASALQRN